MIWAWVVAPLAGAAVALAAARRIIGRNAAALRAELGRRALLVDDSANFFGVRSRGGLQVRGNGALALTPDEVVFRMALPRGEVRIPRASITGVGRARSHAGKSMGRDLLVVRFGGDGGADAAAWLVRDLPSWERALAAG